MPHPLIITDFPCLTFLHVHVCIHKHVLYIVYHYYSMVVCMFYMYCEQWYKFTGIIFVTYMYIIRNYFTCIIMHVYFSGERLLWWRLQRGVTLTLSLSYWRLEPIPTYRRMWVLILWGKSHNMWLCVHVRVYVHVHVHVYTKSEMCSPLSHSLQ